MSPDRVCTFIVACVMAIDWEQPMLEDTIVDHSIDWTPAEETGHLAAKHYRDQSSYVNR